MRLFVYGLLSAGQPWHHELKGCTCISKRAKTQRKFTSVTKNDINIGMKPSNDKNAKQIIGEIYEVGPLRLHILDAKEKPLIRTLDNIYLEDDDLLPELIYIYLVPES